jgi:hypothetical protein
MPDGSPGTNLLLVILSCSPDLLHLALRPSHSNEHGIRERTPVVRHYSYSVGTTNVHSNKVRAAVRVRRDGRVTRQPLSPNARQRVVTVVLQKLQADCITSPRNSGACAGYCIECTHPGNRPKPEGLRHLISSAARQYGCSDKNAPIGADSFPPHGKPSSLGTTDLCRSWPIGGANKVDRLRRCGDP